MPTHILLDALRTRRGLKWGVPAMLIALIRARIAERPDRRLAERESAAYVKTPLGRSANSSV